MGALEVLIQGQLLLHELLLLGGVLLAERMPKESSSHRALQLVVCSGAVVLLEAFVHGLLISLINSLNLLTGC